MLVYGLTGGIGMGKNVSSWLTNMGEHVIDTDVLARELVSPGQPALDEIRAEFGAEVIKADGSLNRGSSAERVFGEDQAEGNWEQSFTRGSGRDGRTSFPNGPRREFRARWLSFRSFTKRRRKRRWTKWYVSDAGRRRSLNVWRPEDGLRWRSPCVLQRSCRCRKKWTGLTMSFENEGPVDLAERQAKMIFGNGGAERINVKKNEKEKKN